jgi:hypothetical protein
MAEYRRITRTYPFDQLRPELVRVIRDHLEAQQLTPLLDEVLACCETTSDKVSASWYDGLFGDATDPLGYLALVLTPQRLIWARSGEHTPPTVASAAFVDLRVKVFRPRNTPDFGLQLNLRMENSRWATVTGQLLLGPEPAAEKFCVAIGEAMGFDLMAPPPKPWWGRLFRS